MRRRRWRAEVEERLDALEAEREWKPPKYHDRSGEPVDAHALWRESVSDFATYVDDDEGWNLFRYM